MSNGQQQKFESIRLLFWKLNTRAVVQRENFLHPVAAHWWESTPNGIKKRCNGVKFKNYQL